jgi:hypothetical protein
MMRAKKIEKVDREKADKVEKVVWLEGRDLSIGCFTRNSSAVESRAGARVARLHS